MNDTSLPIAIIATITRHVMTAFGAYLLTKGLSSDCELAFINTTTPVLAGSILAGVSFLWSYLNKTKATENAQIVASVCPDKK